MMDLGYTLFGEFEAPLIIKPNRITGEGRRVKLRIGSAKLPNLNKKTKRKMAKKSKRQNRRK